MEQEKFIVSQIYDYCMARHCRLLRGTMIQNHNGLYFSVSNTTPPDKRNFTSVKENRNGAFNCFISVNDFYNDEVTGSIEPFVKNEY